jgi:hypothetical protein
MAVFKQFISNFLSLNHHKAFQYIHKIPSKEVINSFLKKSQKAFTGITGTHFCQLILVRQVPVINLKQSSKNTENYGIEWL